MNRHTDATASGGRLKWTDTPMTLQTLAAKTECTDAPAIKHAVDGENRTHGWTDAPVTRHAEVISKGQGNASEITHQ